MVPGTVIHRLRVDRLPSWAYVGTPAYQGDSWRSAVHSHRDLRGGVRNAAGVFFPVDTRATIGVSTMVWATIIRGL